MTIQNVKFSIVDHIALTVSKIEQTKEFYTKILGKPRLFDRYQVMWSIGKTKLLFVLPYGRLPRNDRFNPNRLGLEHLALGVSSITALKTLERKLTRKKISHSGIHVDRHSKKEKIWLNDPDGIRIEFFL